MELFMRNVIRVFKVLSDETRLRVLSLILERECCVCEVVQALNISQSKASRALSALYEANFLELRKEGLWSLYSLREDKPAYITKVLEAVELVVADNKIIKMDRNKLRTTTRNSLNCQNTGRACSRN